MNDGIKDQGTFAPVPGSRSGLAPITRRRLLTGTGQAALLALLPVGCAPVTNAPWADGTFWDDGQGWTA